MGNPFNIIFWQPITCAPVYRFYELNYTKRFEKGSITAGVFYRSINDVINRAVYIDRLDLNKIILTLTILKVPHPMVLNFLQTTNQQNGGTLMVVLIFLAKLKTYNRNT